MSLLVPAVGASAHSAYSHVSQYISELGASGAANASLVAAAGFAPLGGLVLAFLGVASGVFPASRQKTAGVICFGAVGAAYIVSAVFPCDAGCPDSGSLSQSIHNVFGGFEYVGAFAGLLLLGAAFRGSEIWRDVSPACVISAVFVALGFVAMLLPGLQSFRGLSQRVAEASIFLWIGYVSVFLFRLREPAV